MHECIAIFSRICPPIPAKTHGLDQVLETVRRQLPLFAAHTTFHQYQRQEDINAMVSDHMTILDRLITGQIDSAAAPLESHIRRSLQPSIGIWERLGEIPEKMLPPYMAPVSKR